MKMRVIDGLRVMLLLCVTLATSAFAASGTEPDCARQTSVFSVDFPLPEATVKGNAGVRLYLHPEHPSLCASADEDSCKAIAFLSPKDQVTVGNICGTWAYVWYPKKKSELVLEWVEASRLDIKAAVPRFTLMKGKGIPVCDAYLKRLNTEQFEDAPYCGRPEDDAIPGFTRLNRVPLSVDDVIELGPHIDGFTRLQDQTRGNVWTIENKQEIGAVNAWRYDPEVDIDNDGMPDHLVVWYGYGASQREPCGDERDRRVPQLAYVLDSSENSIDEARTNAVFWRTKPYVSRYKLDGEQRSTLVPLPVGWDIDVFRYQDLFYFDTFYDRGGFGDFEGKRKHRADLNDRLVVFRHQDGATRQVCEYRWNHSTHRLYH